MCWVLALQNLSTPLFWKYRVKWVVLQCALLLSAPLRALPPLRGSSPRVLCSGNMHVTFPMSVLSLDAGVVHARAVWLRPQEAAMAFTSSFALLNVVAVFSLQ